MTVLRHIALFDDHPMMTAGLKAALEEADYTQVIWTASSFNELKNQLQNHTPDLLIADVIAPGVEGLRLFKYMVENHPKLPVVAYTSLNNLTLMLELYKLGVKGFVNKREPIMLLQKAIEAVLDGQHFYPPSFPALKPKPKVKGTSSISLTDRETEVLHLIIDGLLSKEIAHQLSVSINTVNVHRTNLFQKFEVQNVAELIRQAAFLGFCQE